MRGGLDDALARMARRDEMLRRARAANGHTPTVTEVTDAVRRVVEEHPELVVALRVQDGRSEAEALVAWRDGEVRVTVRPATAGPYPRALEEQPRPRPASRNDAWEREPPGTAAARLADLLRGDHPDDRG